MPYIFKDRIVETIKQELNNELMADIDFNNKVRINIFKSFPNIHLGISDFILSSRDTVFTNDTIFYTKNADLIFDLKKWYRNNEYLIRNISFGHPVLNLEVSEEGASNWDIMYPDSVEHEKSEAVSFQLDRFGINNGRISYTDLESNILFSINELDHLSSGVFNLDSFMLDAQTTMKDVKMSYAGISYVNLQDASQKGEIGVDMINYQYSFYDNLFLINALPVDFKGYVRLDDNAMRFDMIANSKSSDVREFLTLIPAIYASDFDKMETRGKADLQFILNGALTDNTYPDFDLKLLIDDGFLKYPDLPYPLKNLDFNLNVFTSQGNYDLMRVNLNQFSFDLNNSPFEGFLRMHDIFTNPFMVASLKGAINLDDFRSVIPLAQDQVLNGQVVSDLDLKGRVDDITQSGVERFTANGNLIVSDLQYKTSNMPEMIEISSAKMLFNNQKIQLPIFKGKLGRNDVSLDGYVENFFPYLFSNGTLMGSVSANSNYFNLNDFITENSDGTQVENTNIELSVIEIPGDINVNLALAVEQLIYDDYTFNTFSGSSEVNNGVLSLNKVNTEFLGGLLNLDGNYSVSSNNTPRAKFDVGYRDININQLFPKFSIFQKFAPFAEKISALSSAKISFETDLDGTMKPILSNINLDGSFQLASINISGMNVLDQFNKKLGVQKFSVNKIKDLLLNIRVFEGKMLVDPFRVLIDSSVLNLEGFSLLNGDISYNGLLSIPALYLENRQDKFNTLVRNTPYSSYVIEPNDVMDIAVRITGNFLKPNVSLNLKEISQNLVNQLRTQVKDNIQERRDAIEDRARAEADKARTEAERVKQEAIDRAKQEEERLKQELEDRKQEAEKKAREEAEKRKRELEEKAREEADAVRDRLKKDALERLKR